MLDNDESICKNFYKIEFVLNLYFLALSGLFNLNKTLLRVDKSSVD